MLLDIIKCYREIKITAIFQNSTSQLVVWEPLEISEIVSGDHRIKRNVYLIILRILLVFFFFFSLSSSNEYNVDFFKKYTTCGYIIALKANGMCLRIRSCVFLNFCFYLQDYQLSIKKGTSKNFISKLCSLYGLLKDHWSMFSLPVTYHVLL